MNPLYNQKSTAFGEKHCSISVFGVLTKIGKLVEMSSRPSHKRDKSRSVSETDEVLSDLEKEAKKKEEEEKLARILEEKKEQQRKEYEYNQKSPEEKYWDRRTFPDRFWNRMEMGLKGGTDMSHFNCNSGSSSLSLSRSLSLLLLMTLFTQYTSS